MNFECFVLKFSVIVISSPRWDAPFKQILLAHLLLLWGGKKATCWMLREQQKAKCTMREENTQKLMLIYAAEKMGSRGWMRFDNRHRILIEMLSFYLWPFYLILLAKRLPVYRILQHPLTGRSGSGSGSHGTSFICYSSRNIIRLKKTSWIVIFILFQVWGFVDSFHFFLQHEQLKSLFVQDSFSKQNNN